MVHHKTILRLRVKKLTTVVPVLSECIAEGELAREIEQRSTRFTPGEHGLLFKEGDSPDAVYYMKEGEAFLSMHNERDRILTVRAVAGSILGLPAIMGNGPYSLSANAMEHASVFKIDAAALKR